MVIYYIKGILKVCQDSTVSDSFINLKTNFICEMNQSKSGRIFLFKTKLEWKYFFSRKL